jgi:hypothetical protein
LDKAGRTRLARAREAAADGIDAAGLEGLSDGDVEARVVELGRMADKTVTTEYEAAFRNLADGATVDEAESSIVVARSH